MPQGPIWPRHRSQISFYKIIFERNIVPNQIKGNEAYNNVLLNILLLQTLLILGWGQKSFYFFSVGCHVAFLINRNEPEKTKNKYFALLQVHDP